MDWMGAFGFLLVLSLTYPSLTTTDDNKENNVGSPNRDDATRKVELSKEGIMFGNQQNKPVAVEPPPDDDLTGSDGGTDDNTDMKPNIGGKVVQGDDEKDYQYEEPYAMYRRKREADNEGITEAGSKKERPLRRLNHLKSDRNKRSTNNFFEESDGPNRNHFLSAEQALGI